MSQDQADRITDSLRYVAGQFSVDRGEFRRDMQPDGAALLDACTHLGYLRRGHGRDTRDRVVVSDAGIRRLAELSPDEESA